MFKKATNELTALAWTLGGTGLVLITLSGETARIGWIPTIVPVPIIPNAVIRKYATMRVESFLNMIIFVLLSL